MRIRLVPWAALLLCLSCARPEDRQLSLIDSELRELKAGRGILRSSSYLPPEESGFAPGSELILYESAGGLREYFLSSFGDLGKTEEEYYFQGNRLRYFVRKVWRYDAAYAQATDLQAFSYYFQDGLCIGRRDLLSGRTKRPSTQLSEEAYAILDRSQALLRALDGLRAVQGP